MKFIQLLLALCALLPASLHAEKLAIAAAADLKFAMDELIAAYTQANASDEVEPVYGSSGTFNAQIQQGAPYDLYFSADIAYPRALADAGFAASAVQPYAIGRIVLWSPQFDASSMTLTDLVDAHFVRIAIANPMHAPYGQRAEQALRASGLWDQLEPKLVYGENIAQTAQFVQTGAAQIGIIAQSLALSPELADQGSYLLISDTLHDPLVQGFIITQRAADNAAAARFATFMQSRAARRVLTRYGFVLPE